MTRTWTDFVVDGDELLGLFGDLSALEDVTVRSCTLIRWGPTVVLRADIGSGFLDRAPQDWRAAGYQAVQFHLQFLDVGELQMGATALPSQAHLQVNLRERRRLSVSVDGPGVTLAFSSSDQLRVGHVSAYKATNDERTGDRFYMRRLDRMRHPRLPETTDSNYYERI